MGESRYSEEQASALEAIKRWYNSDDKERQVFRLTGLAGTGKTYLLSHLEEELGCGILYLTYTGKASNNLAVKGLASKTIHSVIYRPVKDICDPSDSLVRRVIEEMNLKCTGEACKAKLMEAFGSMPSDKVLKFVRKDSAVEEIPSLLVIDEASMVSRVIYNDLLSLGVKVLLCGDPGQLPPIETDKTWQPLADPDCTLRHIHRQQADNPIITTAHSVYAWNLRDIEYNSPKSSDSGMVLILNKSFASGNDSEAKVLGLMAQADQVLCFTNKYRKYANAAMRKQKGIEAVYPVPGDKLICTRNNWNLITDSVPLVNGQMGECVSFKLSTKRFQNRTYDIGVLNFRPDYTDEVLTTKISLQAFTGAAEPEDLPVDRFDYGYAITVHKAQGSEWDTVLAVYDSNITVDHLKEWLYTAITRARKQVILYLPKVTAIERIKKIESNK